VSQSLHVVNEEEEKQPRFLAMVALVAVVVALVILVFFGIGYLFGRTYL
jgi:preprotein translocase subunit SecE